MKNRMHIEVITGDQYGTPRPLWGIACGLAGIFDGLVTLLSLGYVITDAQWTVMNRLIDRNHAFTSEEADRD